MTPEVGRLFSAEDDATDAPATVVLSHAYWRDQFAADTGAIGDTLVVDGEPRAGRQPVVVVFAAAVSLLAGLLFGLVPALKYTAVISAAPSTRAAAAVVLVGNAIGCAIPWSWCRWRWR